MASRLSDQHLADVSARIEAGVCHVCRNGIDRSTCRACDGTGAFHLATSVVRDALVELRERRDADSKLDAQSIAIEILKASLARVEAERDRLFLLINTPQTADFFDAVRIEAAHQVERWGVEHDAGKSDADWFWLIGYLAGKALHATKNEVMSRYRHVKRGTTYEVLSIAEDENRRGTNVVVYRGDDDGKVWTRPSDQFFDGRFEQLPPKPNEKRLHHIITVAAACLNWFRNATGVSTAMRPGIDPPTTEVQS